MKETHNQLLIVLAAILIAAFFMPWINVFVNLTAWDLVFGNASEYINTSFRFVAIIIPVSGGLIIYGAAFNNNNYPVPGQ